MNPLPDYAELLCRSSFSFLQAASSPEELVLRAHALGYRALALADECSVAGVVRAHSALQRLQQELGLSAAPLQLLLGTRLAVWDDTATPTAPTPAFELVVLARNMQGWGHLCQCITRLRRASATKGQYRLSWQELDGLLGVGALDDCVLLLLPQRRSSDEALHAQAQWLLSHARGRAWLLACRLLQLDDELWLQRLQALSTATALPLAAAGDVLMHRRARKPLQDVLTAIRLGRPVAQCGLALAAHAEQHLRSRLRLAQLYPRELLDQTLAVAQQCHFTLDELRYHYPEELVPAHCSAIAHLRTLCQSGARQRWPSGVPPRWQAQIDHELALIEELRYEHYFLTVADIVRFARSRDILCQGRGSAANSVVCYCLHITEVDPARSHLLFERFISRERQEPPDIDVDFEHERREEVIQYLYNKYGRERAALAATVISYRPRSALNEVGKALGLDETLVQRLAREHSHWSSEVLPEARWAQLQQELGLSPEDPRLRQLVALARQLLGQPRHLSQHVGGFVLTRGPLSRLVPIQNAAMPERTVIEWDKDDLDSVGLMKVDVLALGMLSCLRRSLAFYRQWRAQALRLSDIPEGDAATYDMICAADTIGVFQIESRAQMSMLPRLRPRHFYDLVVEVAIVRPGPIEGGMVHPYLQARAQPELIRYPKGLEAALSRTYGVPIFQEQVMQVAMIAAGFSAGEADQLRRAMAAWKRPGDLERFYARIVQGMRERGYEDSFAEAIFRQIKGFASYGFPESHAASFALLTYVSSWMKCHEPAIFTAALLNAQPLGFYTPAQLVQDARRHGVCVRAVDVNHSDIDCTLEPRSADDGLHAQALPGWPAGDPGQPALRLGLRLVQGLSRQAMAAIVNAREHGPFTDVQDLARRGGLGQQELQQLAAADALSSVAGHRRQQVWQASAVRRQRDLLEGNAPAEAQLVLPLASEGEAVVWDYAATGLTLRRHPLALLRGELQSRGLRSSAQLMRARDGARVGACGLVTVRQRPQTAKGTLFISLEDEHGSVQVIVWAAIYEQHRSLLRQARLLAARGCWQLGDGGVRHLLAQRFEDLSPLLGQLRTDSRDFR
ncbi:error-prone DNA polymerase [Roseateles sp. BYS180W]|uniref:Error-prone DNA polymerase n=1 Tax=Roseateles rivi TaxID=3299028 RepID=A0ABW7FWH1_9BURK